MKPRRTQTQIQIRSDKAAALLARHVGRGRSQAAVVEDALELLTQYEARTRTAASEERATYQAEPVFKTAEQAELFSRLMAISERGRTKKWRYATLADFDAQEYDERGNPR